MTQETKALDILEKRWDLATGTRLSRDQVQLLLAYGERYHLDPLAGQVMLLYGKPYVTSLGYLAHARRQPDYRGYAVANLTREEVEELGEPPGSYVWKCIVMFRGDREPVEEYGVVTPEEMERMEREIRENVEKDPQWARRSERERLEEIERRMWRIPILRSPSKQARARAIRRAHERAYPLEVAYEGT